MSAQYGSDNPLIDARLQGTPLFTATPGLSTHYHTFDFDCKMNGVEVYAWDANQGDNMSIESQYNAEPYGWKRYKKFGKNWNIYPNERSRIILFPTEPKAGVRLAFTYDNKGVVDVKFSINVFQFIDRQYINPSLLEEGEDW